MTEMNAQPADGEPEPEKPADPYDCIPTPTPRRNSYFSGLRMSVPPPDE